MTIVMNTCKFFNVDYLLKLIGLIVVDLGGTILTRQVGRLDVVGRVSLLVKLTLVAVKAFLKTV